MLATVLPMLTFFSSICGGILRVQMMPTFYYYYLLADKQKASVVYCSILGVGGISAVEVAQGEYDDGEHEQASNDAPYPDWNGVVGGGG